MMSHAGGNAVPYQLQHSRRRRDSDLLAGVGSRRVYYVNSYRATPSDQNADWVLATSDYGGEFVGVVNRGDVYATQFHPEKSGAAGLRVLRNFLEPGGAERDDDAGAETGAVTPGNYQAKPGILSAFGSALQASRVRSETA